MPPASLIARRFAARLQSVARSSQAACRVGFGTRAPAVQLNVKR
jgi:hypothetical protein